jgi:hypothetical protein
MLWCVYFAYRLGRVEAELMCEIKMMDLMPSVEEMKAPTDTEIMDNFIQCRKDLTELAEASYMNINCHDRTCNVK